MVGVVMGVLVSIPCQNLILYYIECSYLLMVIFCGFVVVVVVGFLLWRGLLCLSDLSINLLRNQH